MKNLNLLTCSPKQSEALLRLGILPHCFFWHHLTGPADSVRWVTQQILKPMLGPEMVPAWTKAELDVMIGPQFAKPDLWEEMKQREKAATDPNSYSVFFLNSCEIFENGAMASARGLTWLIENEHINPADANNRYRAIFMK